MVQCTFCISAYIYLYIKPNCYYVCAHVWTIAYVCLVPVYVLMPTNASVWLHAYVYFGSLPCTWAFHDVFGLHTAILVPHFPPCIGLPTMYLGGPPCIWVPHHVIWIPTMYLGSTTERLSPAVSNCVMWRCV